MHKYSVCYRVQEAIVTFSNFQLCFAFHEMNFFIILQSVSGSELKTVQLKFVNSSGHLFRDESLLLRKCNIYALFSHRLKLSFWSSGVSRS